MTNSKHYSPTIRKTKAFGNTTTILSKVSILASMMIEKRVVLSFADYFHEIQLILYETAVVFHLIAALRRLHINVADFSHSVLDGFNLKKCSSSPEEQFRNLTRVDYSQSALFPSQRFIYLGTRIG